MSDDRRILDRLIPATEWHPLTNGGAHRTTSRKAVIDDGDH